MAREIVVRLGQGIVTLLVLVTAVFILSRLIGSPVDVLLPASASSDQREEMVKALGLDRPAYEQYGTYMWNLVRGDVGVSIGYHRPVVELFLERFPNTVKLALFAMTFATIAGLALGMTSAIHRNSPIDTFARGVSVVGMSVPSFWLGLMLMLVFSVQLKLLPVARMEGIESYILPSLAWGTFVLAGTARMIRSGMIDVMDSEFVKLARIKGVSENAVVWKHCLRNALIPVLTFTGMELAFSLNGSVVIEAIFAWPGVGYLIYQGINMRDYPLVQGCLLIVGFIIITMNLVVDLLYSLVDPRIRVAGGK